MDRRDFLKTGGLLMAGASGAYALPVLTLCRSAAPAEESSAAARKWGMVIDLNKCKPDCTACLEACRKENNVAFHNDPRWDVHLIRKVKIKRRRRAAPEKCVLLLCNHCDNPPCAQACPVRATYKRADGIVIVDQHRCIGCRYCMIACPYNARHFNYKDGGQWPNKDRPRSAHGVPESCTFCAHRLDTGGAPGVDAEATPACMAACEKKALVVGDLNDPQSDVSRLIADNLVRGIREDLGVKPKVYYIGL